jgi:hypothetical protein
MRSLLLLPLLIASAAPAIAEIAPRRSPGAVPPRQPFGTVDSRLPGQNIHRDLRDIRGKIEEAQDKGALSRREARALRRESRAIDAAARRFGRDGFSQSERRELEARALYLRGAVSRQPAAEKPRRQRKGG